MADPSLADGPKPRRLADATELEALVAGSPLVLVEYYTDGCGICASMEPVLGIVARVGDAAVATINPRDDPALIDRFSIRSVPTLLLFREGTVVGRLAGGFQGVADVLAFVDEAR